MESCVRVRLYAITFVGGKCRHRSQRTSGLALWRLPIQTVLLPRVADELHSVLLRAAAIMALGKILGLSVGQRATDLDDRQLVSTNTAGQNLILTRCRVEEPLPARIFFQRDWKRKIVGSYEQDLGTIHHFAPAMHDRIAMARKLAIQLYWMMRKEWDYEQVKRFGPHAGQPEHRRGVQ